MTDDAGEAKVHYEVRSAAIDGSIDSAHAPGDSSHTADMIAAAACALRRILRDDLRAELGWTVCEWTNGRGDYILLQDGRFRADLSDADSLGHYSTLAEAASAVAKAAAYRQRPPEDVPDYVKRYPAPFVKDEG